MLGPLGCIQKDCCIGWTSVFGWTAVSDGLLYKLCNNHIKRSSSLCDSFIIPGLDDYFELTDVLYVLLYLLFSLDHSCPLSFFFDHGISLLA